MATAHKSRKLTIERRYRAGKWGVLTQTAAILLKGKWLEAAGFTAGDQVHIHVAEGQLTLSTVA
ncbi:MAG: SymE family type I addiction module toxin [Janthinobacterium lividum]